jgi:hypothetical protein
MNGDKLDQVPEGPLGDMSGDPFERLVAELLRRMGYTSTITPYSQAGGVDVIAVRGEGFAKNRVLIQAKRYSGTVGVDPVRELYGVLQSDPQATSAVVVTTGTFSAEAHEFAEDKRIELIDGEQLTHLLRTYGLVDFATPATPSAQGPAAPEPATTEMLHQRRQLLQVLDQRQAAQALPAARPVVLEPPIQKEGSWNRALKSGQGTWRGCAVTLAVIGILLLVVGIGTMRSPATSETAASDAMIGAVCVGPALSVLFLSYCAFRARGRAVRLRDVGAALGAALGLVFALLGLALIVEPQVDEPMVPAICLVLPGTLSIILAYARHARHRE